MTRKRFAAFASIAVVMSSTLAIGSLLAVDLYLHRKFADVAGWNVWGYRGPTVGKKRPGERRVLVIGGSTALGYGVRPEQSFPGVLQEMFNRGNARNVVSVVNLGFNNHGAYSFKPTLDDYRYLNGDIVVLYEGYNDLTTVNTTLYRHDSGIFRLTGYLPILPMILQEKAMVLRSGNLESAYRDQKTVFKPRLAERTTADVFQAAVETSKALEQQLRKFSSEPATIPSAEAEIIAREGAVCGSRAAFYCGSMSRAVTAALKSKQRVLVISQPYISDEHREQQRVMVEMLRGLWGSATDVRYLNLGTAVDLHDPALCWDGMHLTAAGNRQIALAMMPTLASLLATDN